VKFIRNAQPGRLVGWVTLKTIVASSPASTMVSSSDDDDDDDTNMKI